MLNGQSVGFFQASRGLKQGDPLSLFSFILVSEAIIRGLNALLNSGVFVPYALPRNRLQVTHLSFTDDFVVFTRGSRLAVCRLFGFLEHYEAASGQQINNRKSSFYAAKRLSSSHCHFIS